MLDSCRSHLPPGPCQTSLVRKSRFISGLSATDPPASTNDPSNGRSAQHVKHEQPNQRFLPCSGTRITLKKSNLCLSPFGIIPTHRLSLQASPSPSKVLPVYPHDPFLSLDAFNPSLFPKSIRPSSFNVFSVEEPIIFPQLFYLPSRMPATRLVQWVPQIRVPRTPLNWSANPISVAIHNSQCRSKLWLSGCPSPAVGRFSTSTARFGNSKSRRTRGSANDNSSALDNSIFEQLFPSGQVHTTNTHTAANSPSQQPHAQASGAHSDVGGSARGEEGAPLEEDGAHGRKKGSRPVSNPVGGLPSEPAVLVVRNGSRSTLPSDFYRVAPRSAHLDGRAWSTMQGSFPFDAHLRVLPSILCSREPHTDAALV